MLGTWLGTKFCKVEPNIFSVISCSDLSYIQKNLYRFNCTKQKASDSSEIDRSFQNCGSILWNLLVAFLAPKISQWLLYFLKICGPLC